MNDKSPNFKAKFSAKNAQQVAQTTKKLQELKHLEANLPSNASSNIYEADADQPSSEFLRQPKRQTEVDFLNTNKNDETSTSTISSIRKSFNMSASAMKSSISSNVTKFASSYKDSSTPTRPPRRKDKMNKDNAANESMARDIKEISRIQQNQRNASDDSQDIQDVQQNPTPSVSDLRNRFKVPEMEEGSSNALVTGSNSRGTSPWNSPLNTRKLIKEKKDARVDDSTCVSTLTYDLSLLNEKKNTTNQLKMAFEGNKNESVVVSKAPVITPESSMLVPPKNKKPLNTLDDNPSENDLTKLRIKGPGSSSVLDAKNRLSNKLNMPFGEKKIAPAAGSRSPVTTPKCITDISCKNIMKQIEGLDNKDTNPANEIIALRSKGLGTESMADNKKRISAQLNLAFGEKKTVPQPGNQSSVVTTKTSPVIPRNNITKTEAGQSTNDQTKVSRSSTSSISSLNDIKSKFENPAPVHTDVPILRKTRPSTKRPKDDQPSKPFAMGNQRISKDLDAIFGKRVSVSSMDSGTNSQRNSAVLNRLSTSSIISNDSLGDHREKSNRNSTLKELPIQETLDPNQISTPRCDDVLEKENNDELDKEEKDSSPTVIDDFDLDSVLIESEKLNHLTTNRARKTKQLKQRRLPSKHAKK